MPIEKRDPKSGARLFIPTEAEKATIANARRLKEELAEVEALKGELQSLIEKAKGAQ